MQCSCLLSFDTDAALAAHIDQAGPDHAQLFPLAAEPAPAPAGPVSGELAVTTTLQRVRVPVDASYQHAVLSVVAPAALTNRSPVSLVAVLDRSGSMGGEKLRLVLATMKFMLQHLKPGDQLGLVSYDTGVRTDAELTHCDEAGKERLEQALARIHAGSTTNLSGGLLEGLALHGGAGVTFGNTYTLAGPGAGYPARARAQGMQQRRRAPASMMQQQAPVMQQAQNSDSDSGSSRGTPPRRSNSIVSSMMQMFSGSRRATAPPQPPQPPPVPASPVGEWAVELRAPAGAVRSVTYTLPDGTQEEVHAAPFRVARADVTLELPPAPVRARVVLANGVAVTLEHQLCLQPGGKFQKVELPGLPAPAPPKKGIVRSTLLFTDGLANHGITDTAGICAAARAVLGDSQTSSTIHTFGFGADHNAEMLRAIAQVGDGEYFFIESEDSVADSFGEAIGGLLSTTHQNIQLHVRPAAGVQVEPLTSFTSSLEDGQLTITLGDLFAEERRDVLVRFAVPAGEQAALGEVSVRSYSLATQQFEEPPAVQLTALRGDEAPSDPEVMKHVNRRLATTAMETARAQAAQGDLDGARALIASAEAEIAATPAAVGGCVMSVGLLSDLQDAQTSMQRQDEYARVGSKKLACMSRMHGKQRACAYEASAATEMYSGSAQRAMKSAFKSSVR